MKGLAALKLASFDWVMRLDDVWRPSPYDVPELNAHIRQGVLDTCRTLAATSPLGWVIVGPAGAGKTHLLAGLRREASSARIYFILVDMTDVKGFWETVLLGYLNSLREPENQPQGRRLIVDLLTYLGLSQDKAYRYAIALGKIPRETLVENTTKVIQKLGQRHRQKVIDHQDIIRALFLLNSDDFMLGNLGYTFLLGLPIEESEARSLGLRQTRLEPIQILRGISWTLSLGGPTILALDQLDAIVNEQHLASGLEENGDRAEERKVARLIIEGLGRGLAALPDHTTRTLGVLSCLESTWDILRRTALKSSTDRFQAPLTLRPVTQPEMAAGLVARRLATAFRAVGLYPPYPTWPFRPQSFEAVAGLTPREILKRCESYRRKCLETGQAEELNSIADIETLTAPAQDREEFRKIDTIFQAKCQEAPADELLGEAQENQLGDLLQNACRCLTRETPLPDDIDVILETQFGGGKSYAPLHVRLSLIFTLRGGEETHICLRIIQKSNPTAYLARLTAAMTAAGIDRQLTFRRLFLLRSTPPPETPKCKGATEQFHKSGGRFLELTPDNVRALWAINALENDPPPEFDDWLQNRKPVSNIPFMHEAFPDFFKFENRDVVNKEGNGLSRMGRSPEAGVDDQVPSIVIGRRLEGVDALRSIHLPVLTLSGHVGVIAASDPGRAVAIRRLVEGAALAGVPALVIDTQGDLVRLGDPWPIPPRTWLGGEAKLAKAYHDKAELLIYTPGLEVGRPLAFPLMPDFGGLDQSNSVTHINNYIKDLVPLTMVNFVDAVSGGGWGKPAKKKNILVAALTIFAEHGGYKLTDFINFLAELPSEVSRHIKTAPVLAREMAGVIRTIMEKDSLSKPLDHLFNPAVCFGPANKPERVRLSVISLVGLPSLDNRQKLVGRLALTLVTWLKKFPPPLVPTLKALVVLDEVRDFLPYSKMSPSKEALAWLVTHGPEYGLGLILATQYPKEVHLELLSGFSTWLLGGAGGSSRIKSIKKIMESHGGKAKDLLSLDANHLIVLSKSYLDQPAKISMPMCWSLHTSEQLSMEELLKRANPIANSPTSPQNPLLLDQELKS